MVSKFAPCLYNALTTIVVLRFEPYETFDEFADDFLDVEEDPYPQRYWFTRDKLDRVLALHRFLEAQPQVGKVVSLASLDLVARQLTDGAPLGSAEIAGVIGALFDNLRAELLRPYASPETGELRLAGRVVESAESFDRKAFVARVREHAEEALGFPPEAVAVTGMLVMFDTMLEQLLGSQIDTLIYVLAAASVIAVMGYAGIPLDMMTITIAAISVGIGSAMYYTTLTVMIGFSVLALVFGAPRKRAADL